MKFVYAVEEGSKWEGAFTKEIHGDKVSAVDSARERAGEHCGPWTSEERADGSVWFWDQSRGHNFVVVRPFEMKS